MRRAAVANVRPCGRVPVHAERHRPSAPPDRHLKEVHMAMLVMRIELVDGVADADGDGGRLPRDRQHRDDISGAQARGLTASLAPDGP